MPFVQAKCTECGGMLAVDDDKKAAVCQFCGEAFIVQEAVNNYNTYNETINNYINHYNTTHNYEEGSVINIYENDNKDFIIEAGFLKEYHGVAIDVVIPDSVREIGNECFKELNIASVEIPESVEIIGENSFANCDKLQKVVIHNGVKEIKSGAFQYCIEMHDVTIPGSVETIGKNSFVNCDKLQKVIIHNGVKEIKSGAFQNCTEISDVTISETCETIENNAFSNCKTIKEIIIPESVQRIGDYAFAKCINLSKIIIKNDNVEFGKMPFTLCSLQLDNNLHEKGNRFDKYSLIDFCEKYQNEVLYNIELTDFQNGSKISQYKLNEILKQIHVKNVKIADSVTEIPPNAFYGCNEIESITFSGNINLIGANAFYGCSNLKNINIPDSVTSIGDCAFYGCKELKEIKLPNELQELGNDVFSNCKKITKMVIPDKTNKVGKTLFTGCENLELIVFPKTVRIYDSFAGSFVYASNYQIYDSYKKVVKLTVSNINGLKDDDLKEFETYCKNYSAHNNVEFVNLPIEMQWRIDGKCQHCGGELKQNLFAGLVCTKCGQRIDYELKES